MKTILLKIAIFALTSLTLIYSAPAVSEEPTKEKITIGVILPLTGPFARYGKKIEEGIRTLASDRITFLFEDEACDPKKALNSYKKLTQLDGVKLFIGPWCGSPQHALAPLLKPKGQLAMLGSSASEELGALSHGHMLSTQPSIESESTFLAEQLNDKGIMSVVIIFQENNFSRAHEAAFRKHYKGKIFETLAYSSSDISELKNAALKIKMLKPEALYIPDAFPLMGGLLKELHTIGLSHIPIYSVYSAESEDVLTALGPQGEGLLYSYPAECADKDATYYYSILAAQLLVKAVSSCGKDISCITTRLRADNSFDEHGMLQGKMTLKTIKDGHFVVATK